MVLVLAGSTLLILRGPGHARRWIGVSTLVAYVLFVGFAINVWM